MLILKSSVCFNACQYISPILSFSFDSISIYNSLRRVFHFWYLSPFFACLGVWLYVRAYLCVSLMWFYTLLSISPQAMCGGSINSGLPSDMAENVLRQPGHGTEIQ